MEQIKKAKKLKLCGIIYSVAMVLVSVFGLGGRDLSNAYANVLQYIAEIENELSIQSQLDFIWGQGQNLVVIAQRYPHIDILELTVWLDSLEDIRGTNNVYELNITRNHIVRLANNMFEIGTMSAEDTALANGVIANINSANNIINNSSFNSLAVEFNTSVLQNFPANVIAATLGINHIELFEGVQ